MRTITLWITTMLAVLILLYAYRLNQNGTIGKTSLSSRRPAVVPEDRLSSPKTGLSSPKTREDERPPRPPVPAPQRCPA
jgi:hypothetical protein